MRVIRIPPVRVDSRTFPTKQAHQVLRIAVVGSGISGLGAAHFLSRDHEVTVFEATDRLGGHTATIDVNHNGQCYPIDTGFIVYNERTYPNFIRLMGELGVASRTTRMSFSVSNQLSGLEYAGSNLNTLFAQRGNLFRPGYWRMIRDILRFNRESVRDLDSGEINDDVTLGDYLRRRGYSDLFQTHYLIPMGAAIWSSDTASMQQFPLKFFVRFFRNHGLLQVQDRPQWRTIQGGSREYIEPLTRRFVDRIRLNTAVTRVERGAESATISTSSGQLEKFDQVILACHSDAALNILADPSAEETTVLGAIRYQSNDVVLHTDERVLPQRRLAWSCWNYRLDEKHQSRAMLTYNMNLLQGIEAPVTFCVTLNDTKSIDPDTIIGRYKYSHPVFTLSGIDAQGQWGQVNGVNRTWFCGAYWANGFHEDGLSSALRVANSLGVDW